MSIKRGVFAPIRNRKFFLPESTIARLGGPQAAEVMRLLVEERLPESEIVERLGLSATELTNITLAHAFKRELRAQLRLRDHDEKFKKVGSIRDVPPRPATAPRESLPANVLSVALPKGVSPQEYALKRISQVTPEAIERLVHLMHNARMENVQYNAATKILGLAGIVEVEKSISVIADAEAIIRELNKRGPYRKRNAEDDAEIIDAEISESAGQAERSGESEPLPQESPSGL